MALSDILAGAVIAALLGHGAYLFGASQEPASTITITANNNTIISLEAERVDHACDMTWRRNEHR